ncbi:MAG: response regulator [Pseudomonadota bacterium]
MSAPAERARDAGGGSEAAPVLLFDDDPDFTFLLGAACARLGVQLDAVADSSRLETVSAGDVRLALVDLKMCDPKGVSWNFAGLSIVLELRRRFGAAFQIWVVSGLVNPTLTGRALAAGADAVVSKDEPLDAIAERVAHAVSRRALN